MITNWLGTDRITLERHCQQGARTCYVGKPPSFCERDTVLAMVLGDRYMYLPAEDVHMTPHMAMKGCWEPWVTLWVGRYIDRTLGQKYGYFNFFDVGACTGYYSILAGSIGQSTNAVVRVTAFEPNPACLPYLEANLAVNGIKNQVEVAKLALQGNKPEECNVLHAHFNPVNFGSGHRTEKTVADSGSFFTAPATTIDSLFTGVGDARVDLMKIDAEGMDYQIVQGGMDSIRAGKVSTILLEHSDPEGLRWAMSESFQISQVGFDGNGFRPDLDKLLEKAECEMLILRYKK